MTTSVIYASQARQSDLNTGSPDTVTTLYNNLSTIRTTRVTRVQTVSSSGSTTNPSATFTNTPTQNNVMLAFIFRLTDNVATSLSGWTSLAGVGAAGVSRVDVLWKRAGASESKTVTFTNATAASWELTLVECGGMAAVCDPWAMMSFASIGTGSTSTSITPNGMQKCFAAVITGNTVSNFGTTASSHESSTVINGTARSCVAEFSPYFNKPNESASITWTTSRAYRRGAIGFGPPANASPSGIGNAANATVGGQSSQIGYDFDTSSIPAANTITSTTFTTSMSGATSSTAVELFVNSSGSCVISASNTNSVWKSNTELASATKVATDPGGTSATETFTSTASFPNAINKTGSTYLVLATEDQRTRSAGTLLTQDIAGTGDAGKAANAYLTIIHNLQASRTVAATTTMSPTVARSYGAVRAIASSITATPTVARIVGIARTIATTVTSTPTVARTIAIARTIASAIDAVPAFVNTASINRTIQATVDASPMLTATVSLFRTIAATLGLAPSIEATGSTPVTMLAHKVTLKVRHTISLTVPDRIRVAVRSRLRLPEE